MNLKESITILFLFVVLLYLTLSTIKSKTISKDLINIVEILYVGFGLITLLILYYLN